MEIPQFTNWYCYQESHGLYKTSFYFPYESLVHLNVVKSYWANQCPDLIRVRQHAWGGEVQHAYIPTLNQQIYFKRFSIRNPRYLHKPLRARATIHTEIKLSQLGFNTAPLIGLIERSVLGVVFDSAVVTEEIPKAYMTSRWLDPLREPVLTSDSQREALLATLGQGVGEWHNAGLFHGDMHLGNILCTQSEDHVFNLYWLDNEEGKQYANLPLSKRLHDLEHLARYMPKAPKHEHKVFWEHYTETCNLTGKEKTAIVDLLKPRINRYWVKKKIDYSMD